MSFLLSVCTQDTEDICKRSLEDVKGAVWISPVCLRTVPVLLRTGTAGGLSTLPDSGDNCAGLELAAAGLYPLAVEIATELAGLEVEQAEQSATSASWAVTARNKQRPQETSSPTFGVAFTTFEVTFTTSAGSFSTYSRHFVCQIGRFSTLRGLFAACALVEVENCTGSLDLLSLGAHCPMPILDLVDGLNYR